MLIVQLYWINMTYRKGTTICISLIHLVERPCPTTANTTSPRKSKVSTQYKISVSQRTLYKRLKTTPRKMHQISPYFGIRDELSVYEEIVVRGERVGVPQSLRREMMNRLHYAHTGIVSSLSRARSPCIGQRVLVLARHQQRSTTVY